MKSKILMILILMILPVILILFISRFVGGGGGGGGSQCEVFTGGFSGCSGSISGKTATLNVPEISNYKGTTSIKEVSAYECSSAGEGILGCNVPVSCTPAKQTNPFSASCQFQSGKVYSVKFVIGLSGEGADADVPQDLSCSQTNTDQGGVRWDCEINYFQVSGRAVTDKSSPKLALGTNIGAATLSQAYAAAKPTAVSKIGADAEMFNAITYSLKSDGTSGIWVISFCSPSQMKSIAITVENNAVKLSSDVQTLNAAEDEFCEPLRPDRKDSSEVMAALPEARACITSGKNATFLVFYNPQASNAEGWVWRVVCGQEYWDVDVYSGQSLMGSGTGESEPLTE